MYIFHKILVIVSVLQISTFLTSISAQKISQFSPPSFSKTSLINNATTANNTVDNNSQTLKNLEIGLEGGGETKIEPKPAVNITQDHNREHVANGPTTTTNNTPKLSSSVSSNSTASPKIQIHSNSSTNSSMPSTTTNQKTIPVYENNTVLNTSVSTEHKKIAPRKGVNFTDFPEHTEKPKKPTVTVPSGDAPFAPSNFQSKSNSSATHSIPKVPNLDMISESNQGKTQKYVVPIVIVILSVPFVAILISILYKRGAEWWKYRHYRRMDFLINGMYDN